jgi:polysaccharide export outer membrane protein
MNQLLLLSASLLLLLTLHGCSSSGGASGLGVSAMQGTPVQPSVSPAAEAAGDSAAAVVGIPVDPGPDITYRIGPHDLLKIEVFQVPEFSKQERVNEAGMIKMPEIGEVEVGGLTPKEAEALIANRLREAVLQNPQVSIFVIEYASQKITVAGHVKQPGIFPLTGETTLMQAIALAGGIDEVGKKEEIVIFRKQQSGGVNAYVVNLAAIEKGNLTDPRMVAEDRVVVPKSGMRVVGQRVDKLLMGWALMFPRI